MPMFTSRPVACLWAGTARLAQVEVASLPAASPSAANPRGSKPLGSKPFTTTPPPGSKPPGPRCPRCTTMQLRPPSSSWHHAAASPPQGFKGLLGLQALQTVHVAKERCLAPAAGFAAAAGAMWMCAHQAMWMCTHACAMHTGSCSAAALAAQGQGSAGPHNKVPPRKTRPFLAAPTRTQHRASPFPPGCGDGPCWLLKAPGRPSSHASDAARPAAYTWVAGGAQGRRAAPTHGSRPPAPARRCGSRPRRMHPGWGRG